MITRTSLANEIDIYDQQISDLNGSKRDCYDAYRQQLILSGMAKENIKVEMEAVKAAIKRRRASVKDKDALLERDALVDEIFEEITTRIVRGARAHGIVEFFDAETGQIFDAEPSAKLVATVATGMQTETGRKALIAALDIMIDREEAEEHEASNGGNAGGPSLAAREFEESAATNPPETANEHPHHLETTGGDESGTLEGSVEDHRQAAGRPPESQTDEIDNRDSLERQATRFERHKQPLRPFCLNPGKDTCGGYGSTHCAACLKAAREREVVSA